MLLRKNFKHDALHHKSLLYCLFFPRHMKTRHRVALTSQIECNLRRSQIIFLSLVFIFMSHIKVVFYYFIERNEKNSMLYNEIISVSVFSVCIVHYKVVYYPFIYISSMLYQFVYMGRVQSVTWAMQSVRQTFIILCTRQISSL